MADRLAVLGDPQRERVGGGGLVGRDEHLEPVAGAADGRGHPPGPTCASAEFCSANAGGGGARLESTAATNTAAATRKVSPPISRRSSRAAGSPSSGSGARGDEPRLGAQQVARGQRHRGEQDPDLDQDRHAVAGLPQRVDRGHVDDRRPGAGAQQHQHRQQRHVREPRHHDRQRRDPQRRAGRLNHSTSSPTSPPSHSEPEIRCSQSNGSDRPRGEVWAGVPGARRG